MGSKPLLLQPEKEHIGIHLWLRLCLAKRQSTHSSTRGQKTVFLQKSLPVNKPMIVTLHHLFRPEHCNCVPLSVESVESQAPKNKTTEQCR